MLTIRLSRTGKKNQAHYRVVVKELRSKRDGETIANLGYYIPYNNPAILKLDVAEFDKWAGQGAQPTPVVKYLRAQAKSSDLIEIQKKDKKKLSKKQKAVLEAKKAEAAALETKE